MAEMKKLKRVVIKEEIVALTGKVDQAIVLNQFIYWSERVKDVDNYLKEEAERIRKFSDGSVESESDIKENLSNGWIYKTAADMKEECMFEKSETTMERIIKALVEKEWLDRRNNPKHKWDKTYQYRVNILKIQRDLLELGYSLEGYSLGDIERKEAEVPKLQNEGSNNHNEESTVQNEESTVQNEGAIPEITLESTLDTTLEIVCGEEAEIISLLEARSDINQNTHTELVSILNKVKTKESFKHSIFVDTLNLVDFDLFTISYFKRALLNNMQKGFVRPATETKTGAYAKQEYIPDFMEEGYQAPVVAPSEEVTNEIERMRQELRDSK